jgi:hypothetical protein
MANNRVYTGADGALTLSASQGNDGASAQAVIEGFDMIAVARLQNVKVEIQSEIRAFHEIGQRYATELRPGTISIRGTIGRAMINGAMLRLMLGEAADGRRPRVSASRSSTSRCCSRIRRSQVCATR